MTKFQTFLVTITILLCGTGILDAQERDVRVRTYISPARVVWQSGEGVQLADVLLKEGNGQPYCNNDTPTSYCILSSENGAAPGVLLD